MGYIRHNAIILTTWDDKTAEAVAAKCTSLALAFTGPHESAVNGYRTVVVLPDGSKEGWEQSDAGDLRRGELRRWTKTLRYEDDSSPLAWVEVAYGSDDREAVVEAHAWEDSMEPTP